MNRTFAKVFRAGGATLVVAALSVGAAVGTSGAATARPTSTGLTLVYATHTLRQSGEPPVFAVGADGSTYVATSTAFPECTGPRSMRTEGTFDTCAGQPASDFNGRGDDVLVEKFDPSGSKLVWATLLGGVSDDFASGIAVDPAGNVYVAGTTSSKLFPTTPGAFDRKKDRLDAFVAKLDPNGTSLLYSTFLGGAGDELIYGLALDRAGNVYVAGGTDSTDFPTTTSTARARRLSTHNPDAFVAKLDPSGSKLRYSSLFGGSAADYAKSIAIDRAGNAYVTGETESKDFPATAGAPQRRCATCAPEQGGYSPDGFVAKLDRSGSRLIYATFLGGHSVDNPSNLAVDRLGNAYVVGTTASLDFPTTRGAFDTIRNDNVSYSDGFVVKLNRRGTRFAYATYLGGRTDSSYASAAGVAVDPAGNAWVVGLGSASFPTTKDALGRRGGRGDGFLAKLDRSGSRLVYSTFLGGGTPSRVALDPRGSIYVVGGAGAHLRTTPGAYSAKSGTGFLMKFSSGGSK